MESAESVVGDAPGDLVAQVAATEAGDPETVQVTLTVAAVAGRLGVAPSTLRTWDRRYGLGPSGRSAGTHRRYTAEDVARLETMRHLTLAGVAPADAARAATSGAVPHQAPALVAVGEPPPPALVDALTLAAAAVDGEEARLRRMVERAVREHGLVEMWTEVAQPALGYLNDRDPTDKPGRDPENLLGAAVLAAVRAAAEAADVPQTERGVILVVNPRQPSDHLAAHVLAAALAERGARARVLRVGGERSRLALAMDADAYSLLAVIGDAPGGAEVARATAEQGRLTVMLVGAEAPAVWLPGVQRVRTFAGAVHEIAGALHAGG